MKESKKISPGVKKNDNKTKQKLAKYQLTRLFWRGHFRSDNVSYVEEKCQNGGLDKRTLKDLAR
jgi:hypothetical protein